MPDATSIQQIGDVGCQGDALVVQFIEAAPVLTWNSMRGTLASTLRPPIEEIDMRLARFDY